MPNSRFIKKAIRHIELTSLFCVIYSFCFSQQNIPFKFIISLKGVYESKISLIKYEGDSYKQTIYSEEKIYSKTEIKLEDNDLPGQFILRFDYKQKPDDQPYPAEIPLFLGKHNIHWNINPMYTSGDSLDLSDDPENNLYRNFAKKSATKRQKIEALENVLLQFGNSNKKMFTQVVKEYENQRLAYNLWIDSLVNSNQNLFVPHLLKLFKIPETDWKFSGEELVQNRINHFLDFVDFNDSNVICFQEMNTMMNRYMVMHSGLNKPREELKAIFVSTGIDMMHRASTGHPLVYGWMADFLYRGFEQFGIDRGILMLKKYIDDPNCLTKKRLAIETRLQGIENLKPGAIAPDFEITLSSGKTSLYNLKGNQSKFILLLFWSADCMHCLNFIDQLDNWYTQEKNAGWTDIIAINLDNEENLPKWKNKLQQLNRWIHIHPEGGINSELASKYAILSTPAFFILDSKKHTIVETGSEFERIKNFFE